MTQSDPHNAVPDESGSQDFEPIPEIPTSIMRQIVTSTVAPAVAIVIFYASIMTLPALLMNRVPPIDGGDLFRVFLLSLIVFSLYAFYNRVRAKRKGSGG